MTDLNSSVPSMENSENSASSTNSSLDVSANANSNSSPRSLARKMSSPHLCENIMRKIERDPYEIYEHAKILGTGSMVRTNPAYS